MPAKNLILVLVTGLGWGLLAPASKALYAAEPGVFDGVTLSLARALWALPIFLVGLAVAWRLERPHLTARAWGAIAGAGLVFGGFVSLVYTIAAQHTSVAHISFLVGISPVTNTALAAVVFRSPLDRRAWVALALGIAGAGLLAATHSSDRSALLGDGLMVLWLAAFAVYACFLRVAGRGLSSALLMCLVGTISMGSLAIPALALGRWHAAAHVLDSPAIVGWFLGEVILGSTLVAQTTYAGAVRRLGVAVATIGAEYTSLFVGVAASLVAREPWTPLTVVAGLTFCGALAVTFAPIPGLDPAADRAREARPVSA